MAIRFVRSRNIALILLVIVAVAISYSTYLMTRDDIPGLTRDDNPGLAHHKPHREAYATRPAIRHPEWLKERKPDTDLERRRGIDDQMLDTRTLLRIKDLSRVPYMMDHDYQLSACPRSISSLTQQSRWLLERYKPDIKLFLDQDDLDHFEDIARHSLPFGYGRESKSMFARIITHPRFRKINIHEVGKKNECLRCAVVGNGGILEKSGAGRAIDNHDFVFRLGHASTSEEFEMDVGRKTSFYVFSPETMHIDPKHPLDEDVGFIYAISDTYDIGYAISILSGENPPPKTGMMGEVINLSKPQLDPNIMRIIHPDVFRYVAAEYFDWVFAMPSVDAMTVFVALQICDDVTAYGLVHDPRYPRYYFDEHLVLVEHLVQRSPHGPARRQELNAQNERRLWQRLEREGALHLFKRDA